MSNSRSLPCSHRSIRRAMSRSTRWRNAHSQTIATRQPALSKSRRLRRSLSVFASNFARQNSSRVVGIVVYRQPACRCQKQPWTKQTASNRRNTRSGVPGSRRSCRRYRSPRAWMARRRVSSGRVSLLPIPAIMRDRVARSTVSAIVVPQGAAGGTLQATDYTRGLRHVPTREHAATPHRTGRACETRVLRGPRCRIELRRCGGGSGASRRSLVIHDTSGAGRVSLRDTASSPACHSVSTGRKASPTLDGRPPPKYSAGGHGRQSTLGFLAACLTSRLRRCRRPVAGVRATYELRHPAGKRSMTHVAVPAS